MPNGPRGAMAKDPPGPATPPARGPGPAQGVQGPLGVGGQLGGAPSSSALLASRGSGSGVMPKACPTCQARYPADFKVCPRDAAPLVDASDDGTDPLLGTTLGDAYQVVRMVGEGGMGRVYEARHTRLSNKRFAIKMLHPEYARQPDVVARFQREAEAASAIAHPNVVDVYDVHHTEDGLPYMVGEFLEGEEFGEFLDRAGKIPSGLAVNIARQICQALGAAHAGGVVHRDMKPENVFLTGPLSHPTVKVIDFGISKVGDAGGAALTRTGMIMGTPSYMAPEQARGDKVDLRADVYAVGGILYRALTGKKPFDSDDPSATLTRVLTEEPARLRTLEPSIPQALELVIQRAMAKHPQDRHATMADLDADLLPFDTEGGDGRVSSGSVRMLASAGNDTDKVEGSAKTVLVGATAAQVGSQTNLHRATRDARMARPMIALLTVVAYFWVLAGVVDALGGIVRLSRGSGNVTKPEAVLITIGSLAATLTPLILWVRMLARGWNNSVRALQLAEGMRRVTMVSICASGIGSLTVRLIEVVFRAQPQEVAWAAWSLVLFGTSIFGGLVALLSLRFERRK
ncbi:MAG TPA: serine/threonine-protein kinase [Polyangiaceae bacterium]|nr:serine/threonine-protein kinase [Polyangiaceae bacterium]